MGTLLAGLALFAATAAASLAMAAFVLVRLPADYFSNPAGRTPSTGHPALRVLKILAKNIIGWFLILLGVALSLPGVPGQGLLTSFIGLLLVDVPGKYRLERAVLRRPAILGAINRMRVRFRRAPIVLEVVAGEAPIVPDPASPLFLSACAVLAALFLVVEIRIADRRPFTRDEIHGLEFSTRGARAVDLLLHGAPGQASPAPLGYLVDKVADRLRVPTRYLGLSETAYHRLPAALSTMLLGLAAVLVVWSRRDRSVQTRMTLILLVMALAAFYGQAQVFHYAARLRPYALWNSLWFLSLALLVVRASPGVIGASLALQAAASASSIFQVAAAAVAWIVVERSQGRSWKELAVGTAKLALLPAAIAVVYGLRSPEGWGYGERGDEGSRFLSFWLGKRGPQWVLVLIAAAACWRWTALRRHAGAPTALLAMMLLGPVIYWVVRDRDFFFASRHYLGYGLAAPAILLALAPAWPWIAGRSRTAARLVAVGAALLLAVVVVDTARREKSPPGPFVGAIADPGGRLGALLETSAPAGFVYPAGFNETITGNVRRAAEWMAVRKGPPGRDWVRIGQVDERPLVLDIGPDLPGPGDERVPVAAP